MAEQVLHPAASPRHPPSLITAPGSHADTATKELDRLIRLHGSNN